jgi:hypothetical protein
MKIKLSYPIKEVVKINGGFRDFNLASDGSIIADYGKPHKNDIYRLYRSIVSEFLLYLIILLTFPPGVNFIICLVLIHRTN